MNKKRHGFTIFTYIFIIVEVLGILVFAQLYFTGLYNIKDIVKPEYVVIGAISLIALNIIIMWLFTMLTLRKRYKTNLKAAEVIGEDVQEAYNFAMIGLAVTDDNDVII